MIGQSIPASATVPVVRVRRMTMSLPLLAILALQTIASLSLRNTAFQDEALYLYRESCATFREIGERMYLSRHTVKSHAMAIYRKLNVTCRTDAVQRAHEVGLL